MRKYFLLFFGVLVSSNLMAEGIDCANLPEWSVHINGYKVNQQHVFCGEAGKNGKAKGFHAMPGGNAPSTYISSSPSDPVNRAGIYTLKNIKLKISDKIYVKSFSSMLPKHCNQEQINKSIVYSLINTRGACAAPNWASCGPNAPQEGGIEYCVGDNGASFDIATAVLSDDQTRINTGFPIYKP